VRRERDWAERAQAAGRELPAGRMLPMLPANLTNGHGADGHGQGPSGNGHAHGGGTAGDGHAHPR
jgi:hypothetical protein